MYVPIVLASLSFGLSGGITTGLVGGVLLGPFMPLDVITGEKQEFLNWLYRTGFFMLIGAISGGAVLLLRKEIRESAWLRYNNPYTGLPNEESLNEKLNEMAVDDGMLHPHYLLSIGCSNISPVKNTFGFGVVPRIIQQMYKRLNECLPFSNGIYNHHEEKMSVLLGEISGSTIEEQIAHIVSSLSLPYEYEGISIHLDIHVGCVVIRDNRNPSYALGRMIETALNHAIDDKIDYWIYREDIDKSNKHNIGLLGSLRDAITSGELLLHYQPKVDIHSRKIRGVEALIRWHHPREGMIPPGQFIPQAEQTNLINPLTKWVILQASTTMKLWEEQQFFPSVAVNVSTRNLNAPGFENDIFDLLERYQIKPEKLELEVTESALMQNPGNAIRILTELSNNNIIIAIDDFGTGYSSLQYLCKLPVSIVKIDQYFIKHLQQDRAVRNIVQSATDLAHSLGMTVVAEGVEEEESMAILADIGCDLVQGYHISKPLPEEELLAFSQV